MSTRTTVSRRQDTGSRRAQARHGAPAGGRPRPLAGMVPPSAGRRAAGAARRRRPVWEPEGDSRPLIELHERPGAVPGYRDAGAWASITTRSCCRTGHRSAGSCDTSRRSVSAPACRTIWSARRSTSPIRTAWASRSTRTGPGALAARGRPARDGDGSARCRRRGAGGRRRAVVGTSGRHDDRPRASLRRRPGAGGGVLSRRAWDSTRWSGATPARCSCRPGAITTTSAPTPGRPVRRPAGPGDARLLEWELLLPSGEDARAALASIAAMGGKAVAGGGRRYGDRSMGHHGPIAWRQGARRAIPPGARLSDVFSPVLRPAPPVGGASRHRDRAPRLSWIRPDPIGTPHSADAVTRRKAGRGCASVPRGCGGPDSVTPARANTLPAQLACSSATIMRYLSCTIW